jgi:hypothetical protein
MFDYAAVANAERDLKKIAEKIVSSDDEDGLALLLKEISNSA